MCEYVIVGGLRCKRQYIYRIQRKRRLDKALQIFPHSSSSFYHLLIQICWIFLWFTTWHRSKTILVRLSLCRNAASLRCCRRVAAGARLRSDPLRFGGAKQDRGFGREERRIRCGAVLTLSCWDSGQFESFVIQFSFLWLGQLRLLGWFGSGEFGWYKLVTCESYLWSVAVEFSC